jgi:hypothetical protein
MDAETINQAFEDMVRKVEEIKTIYTELQTLKKYGADIDLPDLQSFFNSNGAGSGMPAEVNIRPDEFIGLTNSEAAEKYLKKIGHAVLFDDIYNALIKGGIKFTSNGRTVLNNQLTKGTLRFVKMGQGHKISFGLLEFYPKLQKQRLNKHPESLESGVENVPEEIIEEENNIEETENIKEKAE